MMKLLRATFLCISTVLEYLVTRYKKHTNKNGFIWWHKISTNLVINDSLSGGTRNYNVFEKFTFKFTTLHLPVFNELIPILIIWNDNLSY